MIFVVTYLLNFTSKYSPKAHPQISGYFRYLFTYIFAGYIFVGTYKVSINMFFKLFQKTLPT